MDTAMIELSGVRFRWSPDGPDILDIPAFRVERGERVLLRGPSGSGKTTLLNLLGGVSTPQQGSVCVGGEDLARLGGSGRDRFRADRVGFIFQLFNLVPYLGLIENVLLPCRFSALRRERAARDSASPEDEARRLLERMQLDTATLGRRPVAELSVGQQQRVAAARALIGAPDLVIADEPTSSVDADTRAAFLDLLFAEIARAGATLLFVTHDADLGARFDRTVALADINAALQGA